MECEVSLLLILDFFLLHPGDIQIGMVEKKGALEVEIIRARGLVGKPGSKALPGKFGLSIISMMSWGSIKAFI